VSRFANVVIAAACLLSCTAACRPRGRTDAKKVFSPAVAPATTAARYAAVRPVGAPAGSTVVLAEVDTRRCAFVADEEDASVQRVDLDTRAVVSTTKLDGAPGQMLLAPDGTLFVAVRGASRVVALRVDEGGAPREVARHDTGDEPFGLALSPDGATLLVTSIVDARVEAFRAKDLASRFMVPLGRDPRSVAFTSDGARAFVTHATSSRVSVIEVAGGETSAPQARTVALDGSERRRDFGQERVTKPMMNLDFDDDPWGSPAPKNKKLAVIMPTVRIALHRSATQGFGLAMIGKEVFLPETLVMTADSERIPSGYGSVESSTLSTHVPFVARVDDAGEALANKELSGPRDKECFERKTECIVPRAVANDGKQLYVACLDSNEVLVIDPARDAEHAPACIETLKGRKRLPVETPTGVAVDVARGKVVAFSTFTRKVSELTIADGAGVEMNVPLGSGKESVSEVVAEGRRLFHRSADARISENGRACASCHVDGREDGLVWPTPTGKRQTPMLAGRVDGTAPYGWNGEHGTLTTHIKSTVKNLGGTGLSDGKVEALAQYVASMKAPPKHVPHAPAGGLAARGKGIFESSEAGCSSCHVGDSRFTDRETHSLANGRTLFDTPSLAFVGQTAPYFHDGRFSTLEAVVAACDEPTVKMGHTSHLDEDERRALVAYLRSL
jgi:DNA-binding beta-propeller fold protein YncE/mono/diheme cytochrome c family protein